MRILYLGDFAYTHCIERMVANAFERLGHSVERVSVVDATHDSIVGMARDGEYELLLGCNFMFREAAGEWPHAAHEVLRMFDAVRPYIPNIVCWLWDLMCPEFSPSRWEWARLIAPAVDLFAMTDGYSAAKLPNTVVIRDGCPDDVDESCEWSPPLKGDVLFLGEVYGERKRLTDALGKRFGSRFRVVNNVRGKTLTRLVREHRIVVGPHYPRFDDYWSDRITVVTGHGGLFAGPFVYGMSEDGWNGGDNYLPLPCEPLEAVKRCDEFLHLPSYRLDSIRRAGLIHAHKHCTWESRCTELLHYLERKKACLSI